jgi:hypothetical protein
MRLPLGYLQALAASHQNLAACGRMNRPIRMNYRAATADDATVVIPKGKRTSSRNFYFEYNVEAAHVTADGVGRMSDAAAESLTPVDQETRLIVNHFPARLRPIG